MEQHEVVPRDRGARHRRAQAILHACNPAVCHPRRTADAQLGIIWCGICQRRCAPVPLDARHGHVAGGLAAAVRRDCSGGVQAAAPGRTRRAAAPASVAVADLQLAPRHARVHRVVVALARRQLVQRGPRAIVEGRNAALAQRHQRPHMRHRPRPRRRSLLLEGETRVAAAAVLAAVVAVAAAVRAADAAELGDGVAVGTAHTVVTASKAAVRTKDAPLLRLSGPPRHGRCRRRLVGRPHAAEN
eukprot:366381-Chlamydomonas_euryale.AAC.9